jgi:hypothetical protein
MWSNRTSTQGQTRSNTFRRWAALCVLGCALLPRLGAAQVVTGSMVTVLKSGLHSVLGGDALLLSAVEVGSPTSVSEVTIEFLDAADQRRAFASGTLQRGRPVRSRVAIPAGVGRDQLRVIVRIRPLTNGEASEPIVGLEDLNADSFQVVPKVICAASNPSVGSGAEGNCDGWSVTRVTLPQANSQD